jgi:hypothetical protein
LALAQATTFIRRELYQADHDLDPGVLAEVVALGAGG